ncbi:MAG: lipopolysaccharide biosynthesis protein, partial [Verrucomicrobiales bacterium]|nr:lipopolysaccharide biosynthesis protein [Verrucomicrobiales bacterium]
SSSIAYLGRRLLNRELGKKAVWTTLDSPDQKRLFRHSAASFLTALGQNLRSRIDPLLIAKFTTLDRVSDYSVGARFLVFFEDIVNALLGGHLLAAFSQIESRDGKAALNSIFLNSLKLATAISVLGAGAMLVFGQAFIRRWVGDGFDDAAIVLMILAPPYALRLAAYPAGNLLYSLGKHANLAAINFGGGIANLILSLVLIWKIGFFGVVWATALELVVVGVIVLPAVVCKASGIPYTAYLRKFFSSLLLAALPIAAFWWLARSLITPDYLRMSLLGSALGVIYSIWSWFVLLDSTQRNFILDSLRSRRN